MGKEASEVPATGCDYEIISIGSGFFTAVSPEDAVAVRSYVWVPRKRSSGDYYVYGASGKGEIAQVALHAFIIARVTGKPVPEGMTVDHWNRCPADNRRCNLRLATRSQQAANSSQVLTRKFSPYRGVGVHRYKKDATRKFAAAITCNGVRRGLGGFAVAEDAAKAYDAAARELHGTFAILNFPSPEERPPAVPIELSRIFQAVPSAGCTAYGVQRLTKGKGYVARLQHQVHTVVTIRHRDAAVVGKLRDEVIQKMGWANRLSFSDYRSETALWAASECFSQLVLPLKERLRYMPSKLRPHRLEIVRLYTKEKKTLVEIGKQFDVSYNAIAYTLHRSGVKISKGGNRKIALNERNTSGYRGVALSKYREGVKYPMSSGTCGRPGTFYFHVYRDGKTTRRSGFRTAEEAARARDDFVLAHGWPHTLNFPEEPKCPKENS